jgi:1D-myo-inositol 3-kinase
VPDPTFVVCGHVTLDRLAGRIVPGGPAYYASRALAVLGARPRVLTAAGPDFPRDALAGIEADVAPATATTAFVNDYGPDGRRSQRVLAAAPPLDPARLPPAWSAPDVLFLAPVLGEVDVRAFLSRTTARLVGLSVQGLVREVGAEGAVHPRPFSLGEADLALVGAAVVGEDEARGDPRLVARLAAAVPVVAFTQGVRGCEVIVRGRSSCRVGIYPATEVDPTGAGDVFAASFLLGLARGYDPLDAARLGAAAASIVIEGTGGEALGRAAEAFARAARVPVLSRR